MHLKIHIMLLFLHLLCSLSFDVHTLLQDNGHSEMHSFPGPSFFLSSCLYSLCISLVYCMYSNQYDLKLKLFLLDRNIERYRVLMMSVMYMRHGKVALPAFAGTAQSFSSTLLRSV